MTSSQSLEHQVLDMNVNQITTSANNPNTTTSTQQPFEIKSYHPLSQHPNQELLRAILNLQDFQTPPAAALAATFTEQQHLTSGPL